MRLLLAMRASELMTMLMRRLVQSGYAVDSVYDEEGVENVVRSELFDALILEGALCSASGATILKRIRDKRKNVPVLVILSNWTRNERIASLDAGADDCLARSFDFEEIQARLRAVLRRSRADGESHISVGDLTFDTVRRTITADEKLLSLTPRELAVFEALVLQVGRVVGKAKLFHQVFSLQDEAGPAALELYVHRLRRKLTPKGVAIRTIRGVGYVLEQVDVGRGRAGPSHGVPTGELAVS